MNIGQANVTAWGKATEDFLLKDLGDGEKGLDIMLVQEHKLTVDEAKAVQVRLRRGGWKSHFGPPRLAAGKSAGVAIVWRWHLPVGVRCLHSEAGWQPIEHERFTAVRLRLAGMDILLLSVYFFTGEQAASHNRQLEAEVGEVITFVGLPFIIFGDWNRSVQEVTAEGWTSELGAELIAPVHPYTCTGGAQRVLDFAAVHSGLLRLLRCEGVMEDGPWRPHLGVHYSLVAQPKLIKVKEQVQPRPIPEAMVKQVPDWEVTELTAQLLEKAARSRKWMPELVAFAHRHIQEPPNLRPR